MLGALLASGDNAMPRLIAQWSSLYAVLPQVDDLFCPLMVTVVDPRPFAEARTLFLPHERDFVEVVETMEALFAPNPSVARDVPDCASSAICSPCAEAELSRDGWRLVFLHLSLRALMRCRVVSRAWRERAEEVLATRSRSFPWARLNVQPAPASMRWWEVYAPIACVGRSVRLLKLHTSELHHLHTRLLPFNSPLPRLVEHGNVVAAEARAAVLTLRQCHESADSLTNFYEATLCHLHIVQDRLAFLQQSLPRLHSLSTRLHQLLQLFLDQGERNASKLRAHSRSFVEATKMPFSDPQEQDTHQPLAQLMPTLDRNLTASEWFVHVTSLAVRLKSLHHTVVSEVEWARSALSAQLEAATRITKVTSQLQLLCDVCLVAISHFECLEKTTLDLAELRASTHHEVANLLIEVLISVTPIPLDFHSQEQWRSLVPSSLSIDNLPSAETRDLLAEIMQLDDHVLNWKMLPDLPCYKRPSVNETASDIIWYCRLLFVILSPHCTHRVRHDAGPSFALAEFESIDQLLLWNPSVHEEYFAPFRFPPPFRIPEPPKEIARTFACV